MTSRSTEDDQPDRGVDVASSSDWPTSFNRSERVGVSTTQRCLDRGLSSDVDSSFIACRARVNDDDRMTNTRSNRVRVSRVALGLYDDGLSGTEVA